MACAAVDKVAGDTRRPAGIASACPPFSDCMEEQLAVSSSSQPRKLAAAIGVVVIAIVAFAAIWLIAPSPVPPDLDLSRAKASGKKLYSVSIEPEAGSFSQGDLHSWLVTVKNIAGAPVDDAKISVDGGMPQHQHGLPTSPAVTARLGAGKYRVEGVKFNMSGWWQLKFAISAAAGSDEAVFNLKL